jgi:hypothetical protein
MAIDLSYETTWYADKAAENARIAAALARSDVCEALARVPDGGGISAFVRDDEVTIQTYVNLGAEPAVADIANACDGNAYLLDVRQTLLEAPGVRIEVQIGGRWRLSDEERETLRAIGKLQTEVSTREFLACAA